MSKVFWEKNPKWNSLNEPTSGDIVKLKYSDSFNYNFKVIVSSIQKDEVLGTVEAIFDWDTNAMITGGEVANFIGSEVKFNKPFIHEVIKKHS